MPDDEELWEDLDEDFCESAEREAEEKDAREGHITAVSNRLLAEGANPEGVCLGDYLFKIRALAKLEINNLTTDDVQEALSNRIKDGLSRRNGNPIIYGKCKKGRIEVLIRSTMGKEDKDRALFEVITAYVVK